MHFLLRNGLGAFAWAFLIGTAAAQPLAWRNATGFREAALTVPRTGKTGFTEILAQTGIRFTNFLSLQSASANHNLLNGAGVAAGDYDGDGLCDLYFCNVEGRNSLFRNLGQWRFEDVTEQAGVACPGMLSKGAIFADVNGDGLLDLLVSANNGPNALFLNEGRGHFTNATVAAGLVSKPLGSGSMALADFDGNGSLDLFVANYGENTLLRSGGDFGVRTINGKPIVSGRAGRRLKIVDGQFIEFGEPSAVYLNDGRGHFTPLSWTDGTFRDEDGQPLKEAPMDLSLSVMLRDINGDGSPDIYVCNDFQTPDRIWINDGQAHFRALPRLTLRQTSSFSMGVDFSDFDRDGHDDFIVVDMLSRHHALRMTQMIESNLTVNLIGQIDNRPQIRRNTLFHNRGDGTYAELANFAGVDASDWSWTPVFLDVDLDGYDDLLIGNGHAFDTQDLDVGARPTAGKGPAVALQHLLQFPKLETPNCAFHNRRDGTFEEVGALWGFDSKRVSHGVVLADLDNDGDLDVVVSVLNGPPLIYRNESVAPRVGVRLKGRGPNTRGINARIKVLGGAVPEQSQEMISGGRLLSADEPIRSFAAGSVSNKLSIEVTWRSGARSVVKDAKANHLYEIDEAGAALDVLQKATTRTHGPPLFKDVSSLLAHQHYETEFDDFARQPLLAKKLSQLGPGVAWTDLDGDGHDELIVGSGRGGALTVFNSSGKASFAKSQIAGLATDDLLGLSAWSIDGKSSLLIARSSYEVSEASAVLSLKSAPTGMVATVETMISHGSAGAVAVADIDGDGTLEAFIGNRVIAGRYPEAWSPFIMGGASSRVPPESPLFKDVGMVSGAVWSDLNGDGFAELILACEWGPLHIFRNDHGQLSAWNPAVTGDLNPQPSTLNQLTGWWTSMTTGDFDGDGRPDIVAGNWGLNSAYQASAANPQRLYYGDFNGDGSAPLVEAEFDRALNKIVPSENLTLLAPAMPFLRGSFPTHQSFRTAGVSEMLGDRAKRAKELQAVTFASMLFLNRGDHFEARTLPAEAQWAPVFGLSVADADGDGMDDLFLAQNFFATRKETPRLDAGRGLWLRNDGKGNLSPMSAAESGVVVWGEQRGCAVGDYDEDGRVDLVVSQNGAETKLFHNEEAKPGLRVRLQGPPGNPAGLGAVLRLKYADGTGPAREVHGGSGYLSQDSLVAVLGQRATPTHVLVRWPGGKTSEAPVPAGAKELVIRFTP